jgi:hypothetical protein
VNAGAFPRGEFHACDFTPEHVEAGRRYANALGVSNFAFHESSFEDLLEKDLPPFDFVVLHGVYSWVGAESRAAIRRIIHEKLASGGLLYVSYNCMPGWASELPVRRLLVELASAAHGDSSEKMRRAVELLTQMSSSGMRYFDANPEAGGAVEFYGRVPSNYLAHEFLNETWQPFYSVDVMDEMAQAGARFIGSATLADNHPALLVEDSATDTLKNLATARQQHLALDFATNRRFRRDVFMRSDTARSPAEAARAINDAVIGSVADPRLLGTRVKVPRGHITFQPEFIDTLKGLLRHGSVTLGDAVAALSGRSRNTAEIARNLAFLVAGGALMPFARVYRYDQPIEVRKPANALVERSLRCIIEERAARAIPSEVLGNGIVVRPDEALAIIELLSGAQAGPSPAEQHVATTLLPNLARLKLVD